MKLVLDAGALIALERNDRRLLALVQDAFFAGRPALTHGGVIGQVWRGGVRQALLARALAWVHVAAIGQPEGRAAGELLSRSRTRDVIDAALLILCEDGDRVFTSNPDDLIHLADHLGRELEIIQV